MSQITFRAATADEMDKFGAVPQYVFADTTPEDQRRPPTLMPEWTQCAFDGDRIAATSGAYPFRVQVNGVRTEMHGVTAVGTNPSYRRQGFVRRMITDLLHRAHEDGCSASILLASMGAIYQRFGYGLASTMVDYRFDPRNVAMQVERPPAGTIQMGPIGDFMETVRGVYKRFSAPRNMLAHRAPVTWDIFARNNGGAPTWAAVHFDEAGQPDGYWLYQLSSYDREDSGPDQQFTVVDHAWLNLDAYYGLWAFLRSHDLVGRVQWGMVPEDDPATELLLEPRALNERRHDGIWYRVVDIQKALNERGYDGTGEVVVELAEDDLCPWNVGRYRLTSSGEAHEVNPTDAAADLTCSVNAFGSLISGHSSATYLDRIGRAELHDAARGPAIDQLFAAKYRPTLSFGF